MLAPIVSAAGTGSISGTVIEAAPAKHAISGIDVEVYKASNEFAAVGSAVTSVTGEYTVEDLGPGSYKVRFGTPPFESKLNYLPQYWEGKSTFAEATQIVITTEGEAKAGIDAELQEGGSIGGTVTNADAQPVDEATVLVFDERGEIVGEAQTSPTGEYGVLRLATGSYEVQITPAFEANLVPQFYANEPSLADATPVPVKVEKKTPVNVTLQTGGKISGRVTDAVTHNPLAGVFVGATNAAGFELFFGFAETNESGEYTIVGLATGPYNLEFEGMNNTYINQTDNSVSVTQGSTASGVNVALVPQAPNNTSAPVASGAPAVGQTLSCSNGSWSGISTIGYAYKWLRDGSAIGGATGSSYTVQSADQGHGVACEVTATNSKGHSSAKSNTLSVPLPPPPPPPPVPSVALASAKVIVTGNVARVPIHCNTATCTGTIELVLQIVTKHHRRHRTITRRLTIVLGQASYTLAAGQTRLLLVHLSKSGRHRLDATRHHELSIALVVSVQGGSQLRQPVLLAQARVKHK